MSVNIVLTETFKKILYTRQLSW